MNCRPVFLIHGILETGRRFRKMADALRADGRDVTVFPYRPNNGSVGIDQLAEQFAEFLNRHFGTSQPFDLIGYSMGGLIARYYLQKLGGAERVEHLVTISSPHRGTWMAHFLGNDACRQMRPQSDFLNALNADMDWTKRIPWTSIWTPFDLMIVPANRSKMPLATNHRVLVPLHPGMLTSRRVIRLVREALNIFSLKG